MGERYDRKRPVQEAPRRPVRRKKKRRRRLSAVAWLTIVLLLLLGAGAFSAFHFLKVTSVTAEPVKVAGKTVYTAADVEAAAGIRRGDRLLTLDRAKAAEKIPAQLPYVKTAKVSLRPFTGIEIRLTPDSAALLVQRAGGYTVTDASYKVLENPKTADAFAALPAVTGTGLGQAPRPGTRLSAGARAALGRADAIQRAVKKYKLGKIGSIDVGSIYELSMVYDGRVTVLIGTEADLDRKIWYAAAMLRTANYIGASEKGRLDVSQSAQSGKVSFVPA